MASLLLVSCLALLNLTSMPASATSNIGFSLSPKSSSFGIGSNLILNVSLADNNGIKYNSAQINLAYPSNLLTFEAVSLNGPFTICPQNTGGNGKVAIACASPTSETSTKPFAVIAFKVIVSGSAQLTMTSGANIYDSSGNSVWDGMLSNVNYNLLPAGQGLSSQTTIPPSLSSLSITVETSNGQHLAGAAVRLGNTKSGKTDASGQINFSGVTSGSRSLEISASGQRSLKTTVSLSPAENKLVSFKLKPSPINFWWIILAITLLCALVVVVRSLAASRHKKSWRRV